MSAGQGSPSTRSAQPDTSDLGLDLNFTLDFGGYREAEAPGTDCAPEDTAHLDPLAHIGMTLSRETDPADRGEALTSLPAHTHTGGSASYISAQHDRLPEPAPKMTGTPGETAPPASTAADTTAATAETEHRSIPRSISDRGLTMYMQPIVDLTTGAVVMVECLARLRLASGQILSAGEFVPDLNTTDVDELFRFAIDKACDAMADWDANGLTVDISVNLDPSTLRNPQCADWVHTALEKHATAPARLVLELLETRATDSAAQRSSIAALRAMGIRFAIDDLGSGFSNVSRLSAIDFDLFKIDAEILAGFYRRPLETLSLFTALIQLSLDLERQSVVEGIEDAEMARVAALLGAGLGQGYLFARPMPVGAVVDWARTSAATPAINVHLIDTHPAALALHFRYRRASSHPGSESDCPLTPFLAGKDIPQKVTGWHHTLHSSAPGEVGIDASRELLGWLVEAIETEPGR